MVSNFFKAEIHLGFRFFIFSLLFGCFALTQVNAQKIEKYYTSSSQGEETLYFVYAQKDFQSKDKNYEMEYDLTYRTDKDSLTFNYSIIGKKALKIDSIGIRTDEMLLTEPSHKIFVSTQKKDWVNRYTARMAWNSMNRFYRSSVPPTFVIYSKEGIIELEIKKNKWRKKAERNSMIFELIELNKS